MTEGKRDARAQGTRGIGDDIGGSEHLLGRRLREQRLGPPGANTEPIRVDAVPGSIQSYSSGGTLVMQLLMTDVTGKAFPALMQELVLGPAGMTHSTFELPLPAARAGEAASAHLDEAEMIPGGWHVYPEMAPAGLWTTPSDLARWAIAIADAAPEPSRSGSARASGSAGSARSPGSRTC
jgi:CubicO group peptidase (beta-lactamase class C family)